MGIYRDPNAAPVDVNVVELNTMANPDPRFRTCWAEFLRQKCGNCGNFFSLGGYVFNPEVAAITDKHVELCEGDAAVTLMKIEQAYKAGWRPGADQRPPAA